MACCWWDHRARARRCSREPLRVTGEVREWPLYHGTRADLKPGDLIKPGHTPNFGNKARTTTYVYLTRTLDAATWGAELALGEGPGRIYIVEPTGPIWLYFKYPSAWQRRSSLWSDSALTFVIILLRFRIVHCDT